ncbi:caprin-1a isoform X2 [Nelusetta ayraudi]|uniref:caprin-1a isoform X2 n=1 Tax=Nelusetta ayraudi TaxID=303726 RepID=UPI003F6F7D37
MPSAMVGNSAAQSAILDLGSGSQNDTMKQILGVVDKKVRNMEKKKSKLDDYQAKKDKGERLNQDQLEALSKFQEIVNNLEFARELQKSFLSLGQEVQKAVKKSARREQLLREEMEQRRLKTVLEVQFLLDQLGDERIRQELKRPDGAGPSLLSDADLASLDEFYKLVGPDRNHDVRLTEQYEEASLHLWELLEGRDKAVAGTTYKSLKDTLEKVLLSGYFDRVQTHQNGACKEEVEAEEQPVVAESQAEAQPAEPEVTATDKISDPVKVETTEFVNRQYIPETTSYSSTEKERVEEWSVEAQMANSLQHQPPTLLATDAAGTANHVTPPPASDPVVRKQAVQDLMAQMQGTYNFMQDSMLEFDGQALDPAIVSAQPMKPGQTVDLQQMGCAAIGLPESRLPPSSAVSGPQEPSQVFNMNAPVPPTADGQIDSLKQPSQFPGGYGSGFSGQAESSVDQPDITQDTLQSVVGGFQSQDAVLPPAGGHEDSTSGFGQSGQSFYNSKAVPRGAPRSARGVMNGYRGSSNGFRGGYDGYRAPFSNTASGGYGQTQFNTSRDYSNNTYQREGYQQGYKRGAAQGPRGLSRGNAQPLR